MEQLYDVAVDAPLASSLTYGQPPDRDQPIPIGACVLVPLGRRLVTGFVLGLLDQRPAEAKDFVIKPIVRLLADEPLFPAHLIAFYRWVGQYYHHPVGEVLRAALPMAPISRSGRRIYLTDKGREAADTGQLPLLSPTPGWFASLVEKGLLEPGTVRRLWRSLPQQKYLKKLEQEELITIEQILHSSGARQRMQAVVLPGPVLEPVLATFATGGKDPEQKVPEAVFTPLTKGQRLLVQQLCQHFVAHPGIPLVRSTLKELDNNVGAKLRRLADKGYVLFSEQALYRNPFGATPSYCAPPVELTDEQTAVLSQIWPAIDQEHFAPFLLFGVTGCGKTEVYLQAVTRALARKKTALILVPEIALASQLEAQFYSRFGAELAVLHSGLSDGERFDQWQRVRQGSARVVLGARSAVFAPLTDLGLVIVDEEHETAYKQEDGLRYNGRDLAVLRGKLSACPVVLGSATPSLTSYYHCQQHKYTLLTMTKRVGAQSLPQVELVDLGKEKRSRPDLFFSDRLIHCLAETLEQRQQSLLFVNRRGFASFMLCRDCGSILQCKHCQVSLTLHRAKGILLCHYCGFSQQTETLCPECGSRQLVGLGLGAERIEDEVSELFPEARVARLDSDTTANRRHYLAVLKAVREGEIDILIGTQMIAKGLHFPGITLVGVIWADSGLAMPDYKASERTFALLSQVTGRAGRGDSPGRVIIQTHQPHHYAIELARQHDYPGFFARELSVRQPLQYPPFSRLINIRFSGKNERTVQQVAESAGRFLRRGPRSGIEVLGPTPAPLVRLKDRTRWHLLLKGEKTTALHARCHALLAARPQLGPQTVSMSFDVDPENMM